ncbi:hypothetical protein OQ519_25145 [Pseudomonas lurida]|uniref:hypothetical protein n=1 Tax=Pseudomonas lurida TaxID=244566 RepID=UPI001781AAA2|nr:hypothetical protein [Pseudomonas lurida]MBD8669806.1 hypothetical protein [Pseudomonas lurida]UZQ74161.1 hypothetical protein OQ519_25145 [Pseudomonas lurida]
MPLTKPNQDLKRDLQGVASDLKWSAVELMRIAERLSLAGNEADAQAVLKMCTVLHADEDRLAAYADEVKAGDIIRSSNNTS